jgi:hypothetical protein
LDSGTVKNETTDNEAIVATGLTKWFGEGDTKERP